LNRLAALIAFIVIAMGFPSLSLAQDYPNKPVKIVVGFIPGSAVDITARVSRQPDGQNPRTAICG
jgi:tripartite-type tricarboxylate transporter receptor subunit TctC